MNPKDSSLHPLYGYIPPQAPELEAAVIGACLLETDTFNQVTAIIANGEVFYMEAHQLIYDCMLEMYKKQMPIDLLTVTEELRRKGGLETIGGAYFLTQLSMTVLSTANVETHARMVMEKYCSREVIRICQAATKAAYQDEQDVFDLLVSLKNDVEGVTKDIDSGGDMTVGKVYAENLIELEKQMKNKSALTGVDTGLFDLNEITGGWQKTDLIIIGARPSKGKTALALNLGLSAAISTIVKKEAVGIFSLEMSASQLVKRMASTVTGIDYGKIQSGNLTDDEFIAISQKSKYFHTLPIRISDDVFSMLKLTAKARKWKEKFNIGLIVIDYLQLIKALRQQGGNREQEISSITRDLKMLAKELEVPIILLSQLNRNVEGRGSPEPTPADLRESGAIEQDADVIIFPWHGEKESFISVAKNRNGKTAVKDNALQIQFSGSIQKWMDKAAFEPFKDKYVPENARAGIRNNYQTETKKITPDTEEDLPF